MSGLKNNKSKFLLLLAFLSVTAHLSGCGGQPYQEPFIQTPPPNTSGGSGGGGGSQPTFDPAITFNFSLNGSGGTTPAYNTPPINTDTILRVKITAGPASQVSIPVYSNFTANYDCVSYTVSALGKSVVTQVLSPNGTENPFCPNAADNQILDFSDRLGPGHGPVTITVDRVRYDFYCKLWTQCQMELFSNPTCYYSFYPSTQAMYCPLKTVYRTHTITGDLAIQINGTTL